ncbi:dienelactone hydrolase endo-1,3,1,4-beta-D-glucanase [Sistotremastrum niveocremeum HHB9708]|uniref:Dienelactone hydrolase endo-1,3,1,4-beta-D-glucanase n=1 Tax=Sistotremastrum niveocremeum HHB9708 TaxID=1314777 RepID=A0A164UV94_9AGAM|nr:dienelactone hydrolase endo-1,3,1,4-beta-D-glucanase [Sistotremastrum niveocremeum HHB9708]
MAACENCTKGYILEGEPKGSIQPNGAYLIKSPTPSTRAIVFLTDVFGLPLKNCKIVADEFSEKLGCDVWVPDLFEGKPPVTPEQLGPLLTDVPGVHVSIFSKIWTILSLLHVIPTFIRNRPSIVDGRVEKFVAEIKPSYEKLGAVGYCFGGAIAGRLASTDLFQSAVIAHPGGLKKEQIEKIKIPVSWECAEEDHSFSLDLVHESEAFFKAKEGTEQALPYEFKIYKGTTHGFAARPNLGIPTVKAAFEEACQQTVDWFQKTL